MIPKAEALATGLSPRLRKAYLRIYRALASEAGCGVYVKTIYVGFTIEGAMVAAMYPRSDCLEIAMALPEDIPGSEFKDATHLTWPTMPVCLEVATDSDATIAVDHVLAAAKRVADGTHDVLRPNEHFIGRTKRGNSR